ncbi:acyl-CoA thioesterase [Aspergillus ibericus CBS 121593]|uniref:Thioesterase/thiol ester dehydrase-isomerase n=1 Tax=Aspergillus ibericus CBS 121593 TaxID=1448316 RepID=A0A395GNT1_9EURO|nr:Thioesterase/thiol ester dehydrase-isomerase [Aspergillus ibericus CBS 121593]RAK97161.1 Thioesterase/thiol ester dehydrase-isomerase [Aspergillus ibericus CBS 121593]
MPTDEPNQSPTSFAELMALRRLPNPSSSSGQTEQIERFESLATPYPPGEGTRSFGGHVYAQSAYAASKTVEKGFVIHNMTGTFILGGLLDVPFEYTVRHLRDGNLYCTRSVDVRQSGQICFSCLCSFKRAENETTFSHQPVPVQERYASIIAGKKPEEYPVSPSVDVDWWIKGVESGELSEREFPGVDMRKVDMKGYNQTEEVKSHPEKYRQLSMYSLKGLPSDSGSKEELRKREESGEFDNLYACAHMYACDRNSLLLIVRALGRASFSSMSSLTLTVVFHQLGEALRMIDWGSGAEEGQEEVKKKWFVQEGWTPRSEENRAVHESWLWTPDGKLFATSYQDSLLRMPRLREKL